MTSSPQPPAQQAPPMGPPYAYGPPPGGTGLPMEINKRLVFVVIAFGLLLIWIAALGLQAFRVQDPGARSALVALYFTGTLAGVLGGVLGALGSPKTDGWQNLGLLILAAFFLLSATLAGIA